MYICIQADQRVSNTIHVRESATIMIFEFRAWPEYSRFQGWDH